MATQCTIIDVLANSKALSIVKEIGISGVAIKKGQCLRNSGTRSTLGGHHDDDRNPRPQF
jgi:hypothetical protein